MILAKESRGRMEGENRRAGGRGGGMGAQWYILTVVLTVTKLAFTVNIQIKFTAGLIRTQINST